MTPENVLSELAMQERFILTALLQNARDSFAAMGEERMAHALHALAALVVISQEQENAKFDEITKDIGIS